MEKQCLLYNEEFIDFTNEPMFFGTGRNTQRFDVMKYPWYDTNNTRQQGHDWPWDEITIKNDIIEYKDKLGGAQQFVVKRGLQRAIFLDSVNGRGPVAMFGLVTTIPELEAVITTWQHFEVNKHSRTYTKHLRAFFSNPSEVFEESFTIPQLKKIANSISSVYNDAYKATISYIYKRQNNIEITDDEMYDIRSKFIMAWIEVNILEGLRFYPFFSSLWSINHGTKLMNELSSDIIFICRDENEHLNLTQYTLHKLRKKKEEGFTEVFKDLIPRIKERFYTALEEEFEWADYLFSNGSYVGMNASILKKYVVYLIIRRMRAIGIEPDIDRIGGELIEKNPIPWVDSYIINDAEEKLPQQEKVLNYLANSIKNDMTKEEELDTLNKFIKG